MKKVFSLLLLTLLIATQTIQAKNIILDLGGVVFTTNKIAALRQIGLVHVAKYIVWHWKNPMNIRYVMFETMNKVSPWPKNFVKQIPTDSNGNEIPYLMYCWLTGKVNSQEVKNMLIPAINLHLDWFTSETEQILVRNTINMIFTPEIGINVHTISPDALEFMKKCKQEGHNVYVLSNWDSDSFAVLQKKYSELFDLCDGIVVSGDVRKAKPDPSIYTYLLRTFNLDSSDCIFFDDQKINIAAAEKCGIESILYTPGVFSEIDLSKKNILTT